MALSTDLLPSRVDGATPQPVIRRVEPASAASFRTFEKSDVEQAVCSRFERQAERYADALAVKAPSLDMRYRDLNRAANHIAHAILGRLGDEEEPVALLLDREALLIAALFGVLKSGKAYVPLDPWYPHARNQYMLENSQARLLLIDNAHMHMAANLGNVELLNVDELDMTPATVNPELAIAPDRLACILYTSGSTGKPKGVMHSQRNLLHQTMRYTNVLRVSDRDRLSLLQSHCYVAAGHNTYSALLNGGALFPFDPKKHTLNELINWFSTQEVTIYHSTPSLFHHLIAAQAEGRAQLDSLRVIKLGGEIVSRRDFELFRQHFSDHVCCTSHSGRPKFPSFPTCWSTNAANSRAAPCRPGIRRRISKF